VLSITINPLTSHTSIPLNNSIEERRMVACKSPAEWPSQSDLKERYIYNPKTGVFTWRVDFGCRKAGDIAGGICGSRYRYLCINRVLFLAHRAAWIYVYGYLPETGLDHINHDRDDNRIDNLRIASYAINSRNRKIPSANKSGVMGVSWSEPNKKWQARIWISRKGISLGSYEDWFDAVCARRSAQNRYNFHPNHGRC